MIEYMWYHSIVVWICDSSLTMFLFLHFYKP